MEAKKYRAKEQKIKFDIVKVLMYNEIKEIKL
jgi:hypothetical protein